MLDFFRAVILFLFGTVLYVGGAVIGSIFFSAIIAVPALIFGLGVAMVFGVLNGTGDLYWIQTAKDVVTLFVVIYLGYAFLATFAGYPQAMSDYLRKVL